MVEAIIESDYLNGEYGKAAGITEAIILDEFLLKDTDYGKKYAGNVQCNVVNKSKEFEMNNTNAKICIKLFTSETKNWIGKKLAFNYVNQKTPGGFKDVIYIDENRTISFNATPVTNQVQPPTTSGNPSTP